MFWGPSQVVLRGGYYWFCTQESFLESSEDHIGCKCPTCCSDPWEQYFMTGENYINMFWFSEVFSEPFQLLLQSAAAVLFRTSVPCFSHLFKLFMNNPVGLMRQFESKANLMFPCESLGWEAQSGNGLHWPIPLLPICSSPSGVGPHAWCSNSTST